MKKIPIGIENFKQLIDNNYYYIDKSCYIKEIINESVALYTRPRRFGKTLNMSMLYYFFSIKEKDNVYLFNNLDISKDKEAMKHQNQYPVIFISLKDMNALSFDSFLSSFSILISNSIDKHEELLSSLYLNDINKERLKKLHELQATSADLKDALKVLSQCLEKHYHQKVIILIDEYDVPLQSAYLNHYYDEMVDFLRSVFSCALKTNDSLEKGIMTGCLRIAKESIFTGLNNFNVYSIFDKGISSICFGFTQEEINRLLEYYHIDQYNDQMKEWYDGYLFGNSEIYNPWSVLKYVHQIIRENDSMPQAYWANTSGNDIVYNYILNGNETMRQEFESLVQGKSIIKTIMPEMTYRDMDDINHIYSFLLFTGYLKVKRQEYEQLNTYELVIPNREVKEIYKNQFNQYFHEFTKDRKKEFVDALINEDVEKANAILNDILDKSISFFDNNEGFYHGFMVGLLSSYNTKSNRESGDGRYDIGIFPLNLFKPCVVIELKKASDPTQLIESAHDAVEQIKQKRYIKGIRNDGYMNIKGYGISFYEKTCYIEKL